ncbi:MAG TPA: protoporphyrinogen oxidase HemJ [Alphaproteobacteria bacterium]|nr:protoporphyrinogen oxidase HemJ [Alphaproteobacteria bacterium]
MSYEIIKALHVISIIAWMAGLLYLPRLYVYHADTTIGSVRAETFKVMERRLLKAIMNPAMIASFLFGVWMLVLAPELLFEIWMQVKVVCVLAMAGCHGVFSKMRRQLENDEPPQPGRVYRIWNEVPTVLMIIIVVMAVVKPL